MGLRICHQENGCFSQIQKENSAPFKEIIPYRLPGDLAKQGNAPLRGNSKCRRESIILKVSPAAFTRPVFLFGLTATRGSHGRIPPDPKALPD
jgi:hypothetical protein